MKIYLDLIKIGDTILKNQPKQAIIITTKNRRERQGMADNKQNAEVRAVEDLSEQERIEEIKRLRARLEELEKPPQNDWHAWFLAMLNISLFPYLDKIKIESEHLLGVEPPRADFLIIEEEDDVDLGLDIFKIFRRHNIIEFKNPTDTLDRRTLRKVIGYGSYYISQSPHKDDIKPEEVTLSIFRDTKPAELFRELGSRVIETDTKGIYHIEGVTDLPFQIVVTGELEGKEYAGYRLITKKADVDDLEQIVRDSNGSTEQFVLNQYRAFFDKLALVNEEFIDKIKRRNDMKYNGWLDAFRPEIDKEIASVVEDNLFEYVNDGVMQIDYAARKANVTVDDFKKGMAAHGYKVPQMV